MSQTNSDAVERRLQQLEDTVKKLSKRPHATCTGGMLGSEDFIELHVKPEHERAYLEAFEKRKWDDKIENGKSAGQMFLIRNFRPLNVTPFSYDLTIGKQAYSLRKGERSFPLSRERAYGIEPRETVIVLTEEYIALPPSYSATVWPRFGMVSEGIFQSMVKIDPTWRGHLAVALTNVSPAVYPLCRGKAFATLILYGLTRRTKLTLCSSTDARKNEIREKIPVEIDEREMAEKLREANLSDLCAFSNKELVIMGMRRAPHFERLRALDESRNWRSAVDKAERKAAEQRHIGMTAYDLTSLDHLLEGPHEGKRVDHADVHRPCDESDLEAVAVEHGRPFHLLPGMVEHILAKVEHDIVPRVAAEVSSSLYPRIVTLTLSVLGFLSLIAAVAALLMDKFAMRSPLTRVDWPGTIAWVAVVLGAIVLTALVILMIRPRPRSADIRRLDRELANMKDSIRQSESA